MKTIALGDDGPPDPSDAEALKEALDRLACGGATPEDQTTLQRALFAGALVIASGDRSVAIGGSATGAIIVSGDVNITVDHGHGFGERLRDFLLPSRSGRMPPRPQMFLIGRLDALTEVKRRMGVALSTA